MERLRGKKKEDLLRLCRDRGLKGNRKMTQKRLMEILGGNDDGQELLEILMAREDSLLSPSQVDDVSQDQAIQQVMGNHPQLSVLLSSCKGVWEQQQVIILIISFH